MRVLKDISEALSIDERIENLFSFLTEKEFNDIKDFYYFYKIRGSIEKGILSVKMYFEHEEKWYNIAKIDLENEKILEHIDKDLFKKLLSKENRFIVEKADKELQRTSNIILSLIALILGVIFALFISEFLR